MKLTQEGVKWSKNKRMLSDIIDDVDWINNKQQFCVRISELVKGVRLKI